MASGDSIDTIEVAEPSAIAKKNVTDHQQQGAIKQTDSEDDDKDKSTDKTTPHDVSGTMADSKIPSTSVARNKSDRERKIGHRRVGVGGEITYKKIQTTQIMGSIQLGIQHAVGGLASKPERDLLMQDFMTVETTNFPHEGSNHTPAHHYSEFKYKNYAPIAFRYFRDLFGIQPDDFLMSMCSAPLRELSNPGASGSIFYLTDDDEFIIKTVQHKEGEFLQKLLPGYYMNLNQNPRTLLPKFFGLYCYQCNSKNVRLVIMNNLLPSAVTLHMKYDLKGSTYKRKASKSERQKRSPTYKDLDFMEHHPEGILLEADTYSALIKTIQRDCRVLESFKIMDYSLLVGVHNLDQAQRQKLEKRSQVNLDEVLEENDAGDAVGNDPTHVMLEKEREREREDRIGAAALNRSRSINKQRLVAHSTAMESIQAESEPIDEEDDVPPGGIPARNAKGERLLLFIGIIDILQSYRLKKKLEHTWKSMIHDGDTVSVHRPGFYAQRFQDFMAKTVFKKIPSPLKHSPSKRKSLSRPLRAHDSELDSSASPDDPKSGSPPAYTVSTATVSACCSPPTCGVTSPLPLAAAASAAQPPVASYPAVLVGRSVESKPKVPPPVPPRGTPKQKRGGKGGPRTAPGAVYDLVTTNGHLLHDLLCLSDSNPCVDSCDRTEHGLIRTVYTNNNNLNGTTPSSIIRSSSTTTGNNHLSDTNIDRVADELTKPLARYMKHEDLPAVDRSVSVQDNRQTVRQTMMMMMKKTKRSHSEADKYVQQQQRAFMTSFRMKRHKNLRKQTLLTQSDVHIAGSEQQQQQQQCHMYGSKVKELKSLFDQRNECAPVPPKFIANYSGTCPYVERQPRQLVVSGARPVGEQCSQIDRELSLRYQYGHEVYNSKHHHYQQQQQQQSTSCTEYVGDLV